MNKIAFVGLFIFFALTAAQAETLTFASAWKKINGDSAAQQASRLQTESISESQARAARHWWPKVYMDVKGYQTNDPGASFFGLLEQRSLRQNDFNPDLINHPDSHIYMRGALGVDLALYEGGMKSAQVDAIEHSVAAQKNATSQIQIEQYSTVGLAYGSIAVLERQKNKFQALNAELERMIKRYQLGSKANPVGYSGLLGMKSLANRITGLISQNESQTRSHYALLSEMGLKNPQWSPESLDSTAFVSRYFYDSSQTTQPLSSHKLEALKEAARASEKATNIEKGKYLPRVGAFAESYIFNGSRDTATGYSAGLYLQWNLFDPAVVGTLKETKLNALAAAKFSQASEQQERAERAALSEALKSLQLNIDLLTDSHKLLTEQSKMTGTLFNNGSINALQIVELLSRRADLIAQHGEAELGLIRVGTQIATKQKFDIDLHLSSGAKNEKQ